MHTSPVEDGEMDVEGADVDGSWDDSDCRGHSGKLLGQLQPWHTTIGDA